MDNNILSSPSPQVISLQELAAFSTLKNVYRLPCFNISKHILNIVGDVKVKEQYDRYHRPPLYRFNSFKDVLTSFLNRREEMIQMKRLTLQYLRKGEHPPLLTIERPIFAHKGSYFYMQEYCPGGIGPILPVYPLMESSRVEQRRVTNTCDCDHIVYLK